jgi:hypothetical protein
MALLVSRSDGGRDSSIDGRLESRRLTMRLLVVCRASPSLGWLSRRRAESR